MRRLFLPFFVLGLFPLAAGDCGPEAPMPDEMPDEPAPDEAAFSCATMLCGPGTYCDEASGRASCVALEAPSEPNEPSEPSCDDVLCETGSHCELVEVQCVRAPCPPQPTCVADTPSYFGCLADDDCWPGELCDVENYCDTPPGCRVGMVCPAVCYGRCVDAETGALIIE